MAELINELTQYLSALYTNPDPSIKSNANQWLQSFQKTEQAWVTSDVILKTQEAPIECKLFAAQTFRAKITFDLDQLPEPHRLQLRDSLLTALSQDSIISSKIILVQLCLSLADLALQLPEWPTVVTDLIEKFGKNPQTVPILLEFLTVFPQEIVGNQKIKILNQWSTPEIAQLVPNTLSMYLGAQGITTAIKTQIFHCLSSWLRAGEIQSSSAGTEFILGCAFSALEDDSLFEAAVDFIVDLIHETQEIEESMPVIQLLLSFLIALQPKLTQDRDDPDKMRGYCRIYVEAGEWYTPLILRHPETFLPIVLAIRSCCDYDDLEVVGITFNFWYRLSKGLHRKREDANAKPLLEVYSSLVETIIRHLHYPDDPSSQVGQEADDFRRFRHDIGDTLKDCCYVLGASVCLKRSYDIIVQALSSSSNVKWQDIEAPLFSMRTMGAEVDLKEDGILPMIMDIIPRLPAHPKIRYATILVLCRYTEWTNFHPDGIPFQLQYISSGFEDPAQEVRLAAAQAMKFLCRDCSQHLVTYLPQLHSFYQNMSLTLGQDDMNEVSAAIAHIIAGLPAPQGAAAMSTFCMPLVEGLHNVAVRKQAPTKQVQQNVADLLERLDTFLSIINRLEGDLPADCLKTMGEIWTVISEILGQYGSSIKLSERICALIRRGLTFYGPGCLPLIGSVLEKVTAGFEASGCSSYLWITSKVITAFPELTDPNFLSAIKLAFERQSSRVFPLTSQTDASSISDVIDDYIHLLSSLMDNQPEILIPSSCFHQSFPLVLTSLEFVDPEPVFTSLNYVRQILGHSSLELQAAASSSSGAGGKPGSTTSKPGSSQMAVPVAPAGYDVFAQSINQVVSQNGYLLSEVLLRRTLTDFPEDSLSTVIILFRLLADFFPTQLATWVPSVVERLSPKVATIPDREKFLVAFKQALEQNRSDLVKESILSLVKSSKRERARERFTEDR
ncbi:Nuclear import receptor [Puccinia graminis f. sp. tritici]|uniref:Nuclear import receptor n=1 Tax=Puccinia graminis f. sp. tritici TaxID=56615 RepID=A0A5B0PZ81_PUCGR|nr:Nuclear import receptor [Puccinia graminis f. sp. tritici]KAA1109264.1 Nuclear import receptor [Puccinia graminis f. sp. tritici]KAA1127354.1 Nuclear import receptor [Puccinia graminis f. sp. tritici]